jgi:hypothetical protein
MTPLYMLAEHGADTKKPPELAACGFLDWRSRYETSVRLLVVMRAPATKQTRKPKH